MRRARQVFMMSSASPARRCDVFESVVLMRVYVGEWRFFVGVEDDGIVWMSIRRTEHECFAIMFGAFESVGT